MDNLLYTQLCSKCLTAGSRETSSDFCRVYVRGVNTPPMGQFQAIPITVCGIGKNCA